ncbi:MAG: hypothetical protein ACRDJC_16300 [Thermomicrobiales bacterium]
MTPWQLLRPRVRTLARVPALLRRLTVGAGLGLAVFVLSGPVLAHVEIDVGDGQYVMEVGFRDEPAYLGQPNALYLNVEEYATGGTEPVDGLADTLTAEVTKDGQTKELALVPTGEGAYQGIFVPTATGDYTFRVSGTIGKATIDESVTSGPNTFNSVELLSAIEFPVTRPDPAALEAETAAAQSAADTARMFGIVGIVAGALGLVVGVAALARSGRSRDVGAMPASGSPAPQTNAEPSGKLIR